jgi:hypothetical protein
MTKNSTQKSIFLLLFFLPEIQSAHIEKEINIFELITKGIAIYATLELIPALLKKIVYNSRNSKTLLTQKEKRRKKYHEEIRNCIIETETLLSEFRKNNSKEK